MTLSGKHLFLFFPCILVLCSASVAEDFSYLGTNQFQRGQGFWAEIGSGYDIYARTLSSGIMYPLVADLDGNGVQEIIVADSSTIRLYQNKSITQIESISVKPLNVGWAVMDIDSDGIKEVLFMNGTQGTTTYRIDKVGGMWAIAYNGTDFYRKYYVNQGSTNTGQALFTCSNKTGVCALVYVSDYDAGSGATALSVLTYNSTNYVANPSIESGTYRNFCFSAVPAAVWEDYDMDGTTELIVSAVNSYDLDIFYLYMNSTRNLVVERDIPITSSLKASQTLNENCVTNNANTFLTAPSVYDYDTGGNLETAIAYQKSAGEFEMKLYDSNGNSLDTFPALSTADGNLISNVVRGSFFDDDDNSFCVLGEKKTEHKLDLLCGSGITGHLISNREYIYSSWYGFNISNTFPAYAMAIHSSNQDADSYSEVVSPYGILKPTISGAVCQATGFCDLTVEWQNPKSDAAVIPVDYESVGRNDLIMRQSSNLWYFDDGYSYTAPVITSYYVNPCLSSTWKVNTSVEVRMVATSDFDVEGRVYLYYGTSSLIDSGSSGYFPSGTTLTFNFIANRTIGTGILRLYVNDTHGLSSTKDLSFSVGSNGVEFGDCTTDVTNVSTNASGGVVGGGVTSAQRNPVATNAITNFLVSINDMAGGIGLSTIWLVIMLAVGGAIFYYGTREDFGHVGGLVIFAEVLLLVMGAVMGFIGAGVMITIVIVSLVIVGFWVRSLVVG